MNNASAIFPFAGGIHPPTHKASTRELAIQPVAVPQRLYIALQSSHRAMANAIVEIGQYVAKGQCIATPATKHDVALHAPTSGHIEAIIQRPAAHPSALPLPHIVIASDGQEKWHEQRPFALDCASHEDLLRHLQNSGLVGLGGAMFPTHIKAHAAANIHTLILNGAECEPWITCDDRLMRERSQAIVRGGSILAQINHANTVLIGIEDNKPEAIAALEAACTQHNRSASKPQMHVRTIPTCYPAGGEKQLIHLLTGMHIAHGQYGPQYGVQCFNVGTAYSTACAIDHGQPLISRIITLTGAFQQPANFEVLLGTPFQHLIEQARPLSDVKRFILGGPMMGFDIHPEASLNKGSNCLIAVNDALFPPPPPAQPCIRCTACAQACPVGLQPFELYRHANARNFAQTQNFHLSACIECGCCAWVCPSNIPLVDYFRFAKSELNEQKRNREAADLARQRFEWRSFRLEREKAERSARMAAKAAETRAKLAAEATAGDNAQNDESNSKKALIAAALARAQKARDSQNNTAAKSPASESPAPESPAPESPAPESPAPESPASESPASESPASESPASESPASESPAPESPAPESPAPESPASQENPS